MSHTKVVNPQKNVPDCEIQGIAVKLMREIHYKEVFEVNIFLCYKWQILTTAAAYYGYRFSAHDALEDVRATRYIYYRMREQCKVS